MAPVLFTEKKTGTKKLAKNNQGLFCANINEIKKSI
jgi:hypothetical protein